MRNIVGYELMTLDGVVEAGEWIQDFDEDMRENMVEVINAQDGVLLGRTTYQAWAGYWPTDTDEPAFASFINTVPKYVVSTTLSSADEWQPAIPLNGDIAQEIEQLKQQPGKNIGVHGSITLLHSLLARDLLDELSLVMYPIMLGNGRRLFESGDGFKRLKLMSAKSTRTGAMILTYQPLKP